MNNQTNVTRYSVGREDNEGDYYEGCSTPLSNGKWVLFVDHLNEIQKLKTEIATLADELTSIEVCECDIANSKDIIKRMRQLSK